MHQTTIIVHYQTITKKTYNLVTNKVRLITESKEIRTMKYAFYNTPMFIHHLLLFF